MGQILKLACLGLSLGLLGGCATGYELKHEVDPFEKNEDWSLGKWQYPALESTLRNSCYFRASRTRFANGDVSTKIRLEFGRESHFFFFPEQSTYKILIDGKLFEGTAVSGDGFREQNVYAHKKEDGEEALGALTKQKIVEKLRRGGTNDDLSGMRGNYFYSTTEAIVCILSDEATARLATAQSAAIRVEGKNGSPDSTFPGNFMADFKRFMIEAR